MFEWADQALEQARRSGNGRVCVWDADKRAVKK
jgi:PleD family two-component response regulator